jgi:predicted transcriptional regulator
MQLNRPLATVTPTLDGDVLAVLATRDVTFTTGQIHRILNNFSEEGIRKVLTRLVVQGVVRADRVGNAFAYRLNTNHLAAEPIKALARLRSTFFTRLEQHFEGWEEQPAYAAVIGSAAKGTMTLHSDVDIFLVRDHDSSDTLWSDQVGELVTTVTGWTGNDARVVEYTIEELRAAGAEPMVRDVVDHGLTVAGSRAWLIKQIRVMPNEARVASD